MSIILAKRDDPLKVDDSKRKEKKLVYNASVKHVVFSTDSRYCKQLATAIRSLFDTQAQASELQVTVLNFGLDQDEKAKVLASARPHESQIEFFDISSEWLADLHVGSDHIGSAAAYGRLFIPSVLQGVDDRVLYLDVDLVVLQDLSALWAVDLKDKPLAAAPDPGIPYVSSPRGVSRWRELGLDPLAPYANSGVLLLDMGAVSKGQLFEKALDYLRATESPWYYDQEGINAALGGRFVSLAPKWNALTRWRKVSANPERYDTFTEIQTHQIAIRHFSSKRKPWEPGDFDAVPDTELFFAWLDRTEWRGWRPSGVAMEGNSSGT